jgi:hypothetical protein
MNGKSNLDLYLQLFRGREELFAQQGQDYYFPVHKPLDEFYVRQHLGAGIRGYDTPLFNW